MSWAQILEQLIAMQSPLCLTTQDHLFEQDGRTINLAAMTEQHDVLEVWVSETLPQVPSLQEALARERKERGDRKGAVYDKLNTYTIELSRRTSRGLAKLDEEFELVRKTAKIKFERASAALEKIAAEIHERSTARSFIYDKQWPDLKLKPEFAKHLVATHSTQDRTRDANSISTTIDLFDQPMIHNKFSDRFSTPSPYLAQPIEDAIPSSNDMLALGQQTSGNSHHNDRSQTPASPASLQGRVPPSQSNNRTLGKATNFARRSEWSHAQHQPVPPMNRNTERRQAFAPPARSFSQSRFQTPTASRHEMHNKRTANKFETASVPGHQSSEYALTDTSFEDEDAVEAGKEVEEGPHRH